MPNVRAPLWPRRLAAVAACAASAAAIAGCSQVDDALSKQVAVVNFRPDATLTSIGQVRAACSRVPNVEPITSNTVAGGLAATYSIRYQIDHASPRNLARLQSCLEKFPDVTGVAIRDVSGAG